MRETRTSGSEGGGAESNRLSLPLSRRLTALCLGVSVAKYVTALDEMEYSG
jgi:hypothetical protein